MFRKEILINNNSGLHARPASELVELCNKFNSEVTLITEDKEEVNAKSIVSVLTGGVNPGAKIVLVIEGPDETTAASEIVQLLENLPD